MLQLLCCVFLFSKILNLVMGLLKIENDLSFFFPLSKYENFDTPYVFGIKLHILEEAHLN